MRRKELLLIVEERFEQFSVLLPGIHQLAPEALHEWRVEFKKLRALVRLMKTFNHKAAIHSSLKDLYKHCGFVRDRQVHLQMISDYVTQGIPNPISYLAIINEELSEDADKVITLTGNDAILEISKHQLCIEIPLKISKKQIQEYLHLQLILARDILWLIYKKDAYLHEVRKRLKDVQYILEMMVPTYLPEVKIEGMPEIDQLKLATRELGNFNDLCVSVRFLNSSYLNRLPLAEKKSLSVLAEEVRKQKTKTKSNVIAALETSFKDLLHLHAS